VTRAAAALFIGHREAIPHDGIRYIIAAGRVERQGEEDRTGHYALLGELGAALHEAEDGDA
jgi:hypothetical protein